MDKQTQVRKYSKTEEMKTYNVSASLIDLAKKEMVSKATIDFDIISVFSYIKEPGSKSEIALSDYHLKNLKDPNFILNPKIQISQDYMIKFRPYVGNATFKPEYTVTTDKHKCIAKIVFKTKSIFPTNRDFTSQLLAFMNKVKLKHSMLINILDDVMNEDIKKFVAKYLEDKKLTEDTLVYLTKWPQPKESFNDQLIICYKQKNQKEVSELEKIDYADRDFIINVAKDEVLIEYIKAIKGKPGRSYNGKFIETKEPTSDNYPSFGFDDNTIKVEEIENEKRVYISKEDGYVVIDKGILKVETEVKLKAVTLKETGHIKAGLDNNVKLRIESKDFAQDVVGSDMIVEAQEIRIVGSIASGSNVSGQLVEIDGQTHKTSVVNSKNIKIKVHKGTATGKDIFIKNLEGGVVIGDKVFIENVIGGEIKARFVEIGTIKSKTNITVAEAIIINKLECGENHFIVDPVVINKIEDELSKTSEDLKVKKELLETKTKELAILSNYLNSNKSSFEEVKTKIFEDRKASRETNSAILTIFKNYALKLKKLEVFYKELETLEEELEFLESKTSIVDKITKDAFIYNKDGKWIGRNDIKFNMHSFKKCKSIVLDNGFAEIIRVVDDKEEGLKLGFSIKDKCLDLDFTDTADKVDIYSDNFELNDYIQRTKT